MDAAIAATREAFKTWRGVQVVEHAIKSRTDGYNTGGQGHGLRTERGAACLHRHGT